MASFHKTPTDWATPLFPETFKMNPKLKDWPHNNMVFWVAKNGPMPDAFLPFLNSIGQAEISLGKLFKVSEISKKTVTVHADFHDYNFLYENNKKETSARGVRRRLQK